VPSRPYGGRKGIVPPRSCWSVVDSLLRGRRVLLRPLRPTDAVPLGRFLRDGMVTRYLPSRVRRENGRQFVRRVLTDQRSGGGVAFAILSRETGEVVGQIRLIDWSRLERSAEVGYWLGRRYWGNGFGTESVWLVARFGFRRMSLHRIHASVTAGNERSESVLQRVGFRPEGVLRRATRHGGRWRDDHLFGLLRGELVAPESVPTRNRR